MWNLIAPTIAISILLLSLGIMAAWNVQRQQASVAELINLEFHNTLAAQRLLLVVSDLRQLLRQYGRTHDQEQLEQIAQMREVIETQLAPLHDFARNSDPNGDRDAARTSLKIWTALHEGTQKFFEEFAHYRTIRDPDEQEAAILALDDLLNERLQLPASVYVRANEEAADRTNEANRRTANQVFEAFLLLGVCGGTAGLVAGLAIARGLRRRMLKLDVSVRGAADKLNEAVGPVKISSFGGWGDLELGLKQVEDHISVVVERLQERELEILRNQQFAAAGQLAAGLAHELRNPLMPMKMLVQRALARPDSPSLTARQLQVIDEEIRRLEGLVQEFLDFARPQPLQRMQIDLVEVIRQAMELVSARAHVQHVDIIGHFPDEPIEVDADPLRIRQVLLNLFLNSLDEQPEQGRIDISVQPVPGHEERQAGKMVRIIVSDSGPGIREDLRDRIFEPFVSGKETGTGLGLPICHRIVEEHGGKLTAINQPNGGALFEILLPMRTPRRAEPLLAAQSEVQGEA